MEPHGNKYSNTIYKPIRSFSNNVLGSKWAPLPTMLASFLVSGLMHELLFYYVRRASPTWEITWYFVLHGASVVVEFGLKGCFPASLNCIGRCRHCLRWGSWWLLLCGCFSTVDEDWCSRESHWRVQSLVGLC